MWRRCEYAYILKAPQTLFFIMSLSFSLSIMVECLSFSFLFPHFLFQIPSSVFSLAKLYYAYAVLVTYVVQLYVPIAFLESPLYRKLRLFRLEQRWSWLKKHLFLIFQLLFRTLLVLITGMIILTVTLSYILIKIIYIKYINRYN